MQQQLQSKTMNGLSISLIFKTFTFTTDLESCPKWLCFGIQTLEDTLTGK
jgi:hypothetical protein